MKTNNFIESIKFTLMDKVGAAVSVQEIPGKPYPRLRIWFSEISRQGGPFVTVEPLGLSRHLVVLGMGDVARPIASQMMLASDEQKVVARGLFELAIQYSNTISVAGEDCSGWDFLSPDFKFSILLKRVENHASEKALMKTCIGVVVPIMAGLAELIGYDALDNDDAGEFEGAIAISIVKRRERSRRNRLLCLECHGYKCFVCGMNPAHNYGVAGNILEVHHLQPLSLNEGEVYFDPKRDLIPICPNCHAAAHSKKPIPYSPSEIRLMMRK